MTLEYLKNRINSAPQLEFGEIFNESIELFKKSIVYGFVLQIITFVLVLPLLILFYVPFVVAIVAAEESGQYDATYDSVFAGFGIMTFIFLIAGILIIATLTILLRAGFLKILRALDYGLETKTKDLFFYFKGEYLGKVLVLVLLATLICVVAVSLLFLPLLYVIVPVTFFTYIFAFNPELSVSEIIAASFSLGTKKWLISFGLFFVASILAAIVGFLLCGIGSLFTAAFAYHPMYYIYKKVIGFENTLET